MPYKTREELPDSVTRHTPAHAQDIYKDAFNSAWNRYADAADRRGDESREEASHRVAWAAVKQSYHKGDDGQWHRD